MNLALTFLVKVETLKRSLLITSLKYWKFLHLNNVGCIISGLYTSLAALKCQTVQIFFLLYKHLNIICLSSLLLLSHI